MRNYVHLARARLHCDWVFVCKLKFNPWILLGCNEGALSEPHTLENLVTHQSQTVTVRTNVRPSLRLYAKPYSLKNKREAPLP